jgi:glycine/D-amino acid oxidase-like deaminating enzyme
MEHSTWQAVQIPAQPGFKGSATADAVIIGGGIAGISTAYLLAKAGKKVIVLEKGNPTKDSVTAYTTAFLTRSLDTDFADLQKMYGDNDTKKILQSHEDAIDLIERIIKDENIDCDFTRTPNYSVALSESGGKTMKEEADVSNELGFKASMKEPSFFPFKNYGAMQIDDQAMFHPLRYIAGVREAFLRLGGEFYDNSEALSIEGDKKVEIRTAQGTVTADAVVIATYNPFTQPWWFIFKKGMYKSYVLELKIEKGSMPDGMYEDDDNPYHYFRVEGEHMIIGGEDHRIELKLDPERSFNALKKYIDEDLGLKNYEIVTRWTGPILEQTDGIPLIGRYSKKYPNRYVETAFSGNGMTNGTIAAMVVSDLILGNANKYSNIYDPRRAITLTDVVLKGRDYLTEVTKGVFKNLFQSKKATTR